MEAGGGGGNAGRKKMQVWMQESAPKSDGNDRESGYGVQRDMTDRWVWTATHKVCA